MVSPMWSLSNKSTLGNVYHVARDDNSAVCSRAIKLIEGTATESPVDGYRCARCTSLWNGFGSKLKQVRLWTEDEQHVD